MNNVLILRSTCYFLKKLNFNKIYETNVVLNLFIETSHRFLLYLQLALAVFLQILNKNLNIDIRFNIPLSFRFKIN